MSGTIEWLRKNNVPVTREHYFGATWLTPEWDWRLPLPAEMESELPKCVQFPRWGELSQAELDLIFRDVPDEYMSRYL